MGKMGKMIKNDFITRLKDERGVTIIIVAIAIVMLLSFVALAVDIGFVKVTRNELQNVGDASSLAATRELGERHSVNDPTADDCSTARTFIVMVAQNIGQRIKRPEFYRNH
jgi:Flp pilus assembly protein TadG